MTNSQAITDAWSTKKSRLKFNFDKATAVLIDSNALSLEVLTGILSGFGFRRLNRFLDMRKATDFVKLNPIDIIFIDPYVYGEEGFDFVKWVRSERIGSNSNVPIFIITGHAFLRAVSDTRQAGADYVIAKPFSPAVLLERIVWVSESEGRRGALTANTNLVSSEGSGVEMW